MLKMKKIFALTLSAALLMGLWGCKNPEKPDPTQPNQQSQQTEPTNSHLTDPDATTPLVPLDPDATTPGIVLSPTKEVDLGNGLRITDIGSYTGIYMEDGKDDFVTDMLMAVLKNQSTQDLQLAQFQLTYGDFTAEFEVTNLPAGEAVVLLEKNRRAYTDQTHTDVTVTNLAFFAEPMGLCQERVKLTEGEGFFTVENLTETPFQELYIYYKNSASDIFYGGITYRTRLSKPLNPGESQTLSAAHFYPGASTVVDVRPVEN